MSTIKFNTDGSIECYSVNAQYYNTTGKVNFNNSSGINAGYFFITNSDWVNDLEDDYYHNFEGITNKFPHFGYPIAISPNQTLSIDNSLSKVNCTELKLSYSPYIESNGISGSFSDLFEAPYSNFSTVSFSGISVNGSSLNYIKRPSSRGGSNPNDRFYYCSGLESHVTEEHHTMIDGALYTLYDAAPKGHIASNTKIATVINNTDYAREVYIRSADDYDFDEHTQRKGIYVAVYNDDGNIISSNYYYNSDRGKYRIFKVGVLLCGAGGAGGGGYTTGTPQPDWSGGGGGGSGTCLCLLDLENNDYWITLGAKGIGSATYIGASGGDSYIERENLETQDYERIVTCYGGSGGNRRTGGAGGSVNHATCEEYIASSTGGTGGAGYSSSGDGTAAVAGSGTSIEGKFYADSFLSDDDKVSITTSGGSAGSTSGRGGGGGGSSAMYVYNPYGPDSYYGQGGRGGSNPSSSGTINKGSNGTGAALFIYY